MKPFKLLVLGALGATVAACHGSSSEPRSSREPSPANRAIADAPTDAGGAPADAAVGAKRCALQITDEHGAVTSTEGVAQAISDYWISDQTLRAYVRRLHSRSDRPAAQPDRQLDELLKQDVRLAVLMLQCSTGGADGGLVGLKTLASRTTDVRFRPGTYPIGPSWKRGQFDAFVALDANGKIYTASRGSIDLTRFDASGVTGTFTFTATTQLDHVPVKVTGSFEVAASEDTDPTPRR